jgi:zinc carboxypeptidase
MTARADAHVPAWLTDEIATVADAAAFGSTDELAARTADLASAHRDVSTLRMIGRSVGGEPLACLTIDGGRAAWGDAIVFGLPHPNEPVGGLTSLHLAGRLAADAGLRRRLGLTWHVVPNVDPDGLRLNEGWLRGPFTREHYARHFYRQAFDDQIDWHFPVDTDGASLAIRPETAALMSLIDRHRPALLASLHNAEVGDVYYYVGRDEPRLYPTLQRIPEILGLSLYRGMPEAAWVRPLADGVFRAADIRDSIDHRLASGGPPRLESDRNSSAAYASRQGALALVAEVPYWRDPRSSDATATNVSLVDALAAGGKHMLDLSVVLTDALTDIAGSTITDTPFLRASRYYTAAAAETAEEYLRREPSHERRATVAEAASIIEIVHMFRLRHGGMLLRALEDERRAGNTRAAIRSTRERLAARYRAWCAEAEEDARQAGLVRNPIRALVATQYAAILATAHHLAA